MSLTDKNFITVVSGLPRSGTSMMMRMLDCGGLPVVTDGLRTADDDNPLGYYEFEPVKQLGKGDSSWLAAANGKVVKIIYVFLSSLPPSHFYKVIFMKRDLGEVVASQKKMLRRRNEADRMSDAQLIAAYSDHLQKVDAWLRRQPNLSVLYCDYAGVVSDPESAASETAEFLGLDLDVAAMSRSVEPSLRRNRAIAAGESR